ncbi:MULTISPECIES: serine hydrolase [unclassified Flavobacterium]|uniref:serine hydrolase domain-containing protein n=1 Tax=unclassified Flavobacterium TaxID=196869 RepID=UPI00131E6375|nr:MULTISPECIES: serine hydrolase domain-containing protein [unclassified Flavobacterium]
MKNRNQTSVSFAVLLFTILPTVLFCQKNTAAAIEKYMQAQHDINQFSGTVLVSKNDTVLFKKAYGFADYEQKIKNTIDTKFQLASVTKQFTAAAILQLVQEGKLSLNDPLSRFVPDYPKANQVTIHMLLSHSSGLAMGFKNIATSAISADSAYNEIKKMPYEFEPGTNTAYSNIGYYLLAKIIESVSGEKYSTYLQKHVFEKAGMYNSGVITNDALIPKKAKNYTKEHNHYVSNPYINWDINYGHDGVYATVEDLALWDKALYGTSILSEKMKQQMFTPYSTENWGYGFVINPFYNHGHELIAHDGGFFGAMTSFNRFTKDRVLVTVLSNNESLSHIIAYGLSALVFQKEVTLPYKHKKIKANPSIYNQYTGQFGTIEIIKIGNKLYYNSMELELIPESKTKFFRSDDNDRTVEFIADKNGNYNLIVVTKGGVKEIFTKNNPN